jgi:hypothetical protein
VYLLGFVVTQDLAVDTAKNTSIDKIDNRLIFLP